MKTGVDLVCQREQNSLSRDFLRKLHRSGNEPFSCLSIIFLLYPGASAVFQHSTILSTSVLQSDVAQVLYQEIYSLHLSIHLLFVSVHSNLFMKDPTFSRRIKGVSIVKRHCVCLDVFLHDSIYPCILSTDSYLSSRQLNLAFIFSHNRQTEGCKAACQAKNMKWAKVFKLGIWSWSLISSYMTKKSHNFGWFILKQCMLSHCLPAMSSSGNTDLDENSP